MLNMKTGKRIVSMMLVLAFVILMIPALDIRIGAAFLNDRVYTFEAGDVAVITQELINEVADDMPAEDAAVFRKSPVFQITQGVYSVTVNGPFSYTDPTTNVTEEISVTVIFGQQSGGTYTGVTIDRTNESVSSNNSTNASVGDATSGYADLSDLYDAGRRLGWSSNYVPTAPFMIMNGAKVKTLFLGNCEIKAGLNRVSVTRSNGNNPKYQWTAQNNRCGYAGIQVEGESPFGESSLEIMDVTGGKLSVYGSYQLAGTNGYDTDPLKVNPIFDNKNGRDPYATPSGANYRYRAGGAAIGGGAPYNADDSVSVGYKAGTPGTIIINGGEIYAVGGHLAAAIGGAFNGASTTSKIEINGGNITAIGGRYATGIGDGDTVDRQYTDNRSGPSPCFGEPAQIIINGGTIDAYGGTAAAAIGTGDKITMSEGLGETARSRLQISINGGVINAQSGEADTNSWAGEVTAAAIGVGQSTYMVENSITIHSNATVFARSFSIYAISEKPITENQAGTVVPMVNIDPEGYMYLARFTGNTQARQLTLYPVFRDIMDKPISFQGNAYKVLNGDDVGTLYAVDSADTGKALYQVKSENVGDGKPIFVIDDSNGSTYDEPVYFNNTSTAQDADKFSYYYDVTAGRVFDVPANYKAVALSLKKGDYVFHVPLFTGNENATNNNLINDVYAHFHKELPGTTSAQIVDSENMDPPLVPYHFIYQQKEITHESPNVKIDGTAEAFTNIRLTSITNPPDVFMGLVTSQEVPATTYVPTTLGYKVYLPNGTEQFDLNLLYETAGINLKSIVLDCDGLTIVSGDANTTTGDVTPRDGDNTIRLEFGTDPNTNAPLTEGEIWVHKTDTTSSGQVYLTYKITVLIKPQYFMHINSLSKKYDGKPVDPQILTVTENRGGEWFDWTEPHMAEYGQYKSTHTSQGEINSWTHIFNKIPVTIRYEVIPNETETAVSVKTYFEYKLDGNNITKVTTVNINLEDNSADPQPVYTLGGASDTVLMASTGGNYRIMAFETAEGDWQVNVTFIDLENQSQVTTYNVLTVSADMQIKKTDATLDEIPSQTGDGKKVWSSKNQALDFAKREAEASLKVETSGWKYGAKFEGTYTRDEFKDHTFHTTTIDWKDRYSDSYFYADGKTEVHTDTISIKVGDEQREDYSYSIEHDYMYMYHAFHYYAEIIPSGNTVPFSADDIAKVEIEYFRDLNEDGILDDNNDGSYDGEAVYIGDKNNPPKDADDYILVARYIGETFEAYSYVAFEIRKRPIKILAVENWLKYFTEEELDELRNAPQPTSLKTYPLNPTEDKYNFGNVIFDDVVDGDTVEISPAVYAYFNEITISHNENKITLRYDAVYQKDSNGNYVFDEAGNKIVLQGYQVDWLGDLADIKDANGNYLNDNRNYELTGVSNFRYEYLRDANGNIQYENGKPVPNNAPLNFSYIHVPGTLSYIAEGTIFKKTETETSVWRKFWPYWDEEFLKWDPNFENELGHYYVPSETENRIDYHSPSNASHQNYVYLRTVNGDRGETYSIDIEYGSMNFVFAKSVWDVNTLTYVETDDSFWLGNDGTTNSITVINRSDADIKYSISVTKETTWGWNLNIDLSKYPEGLDDNDQASLLGASVENIVVTPPVDPETKQGLGVPTESTHYLIVSGNPLNTNKQQVGMITVTIGPN